MFSRGLRQLRLFTLSFDWLSVFSKFFIGQNDHFGFGFTTFNWKLLYETQMFLFYNFVCDRVSPRLSFALFYVILFRECHYSNFLLSVVVRQ